MKGSVGAERITRDMAKPLNHDSPWKVTVEKFTRSLLEVTFPEVAAGIDWSVEPKSLEEELRMITPDSEVGTKWVDKLLKVRLLDGTDGSSPPQETGRRIQSPCGPTAGSIPWIVS